MIISRYLKNHDQEVPRISSTLIPWLRSFWKFSLFYGQFLTQRLSGSQNTRTDCAECTDKI